MNFISQAPTRFTIHIRITMEFALLFTRFEKKKNSQNKNKKKHFPFFPHMQSAMVRQQCTYRIHNCCEIQIPMLRFLSLSCQVVISFNLGIMISAEDGKLKLQAKKVPSSTIRCHFHIHHTSQLVLMWHRAEFF